MSLEILNYLFMLVIIAIAIKNIYVSIATALDTMIENIYVALIGEEKEADIDTHKSLLENAAKQLRDGEDINLNHQDEQGCTVLMYACMYEFSSYIALYLLSKDIDVNLQDEQGNTALVYACQSGSNNLPLYLLKANANANLYSMENNSPLALACHHNMSDVVLQLVKCGSSYSRFCRSTNFDIQKILSFNFLEYPIRHKFVLSNTYQLNSLNYARVKTLFLLRQCHSSWQLLPNELMEHILQYVFL